jgi:hypothetical protein
MKLKMRSVFVGVLALASIITAVPVVNKPVLAQSPSACRLVSVGFATNQLPLNTYPIFTITGPGNATISSLRLFPGNGNNFQSVNTTDSGAPLPPGNYRIDVRETAGTSHLTSINSIPGLSGTAECPSDTSILFFLTYAPAAPSGGPSLRINPAPQTVQAGASNPVFFGAEYSTDGNTWSDVSGSATFSSPQEGTLIHNAGSPHAGNLQEIYGEQAGTAQVVATYAGLTASANLTVTVGAPRPPRSPSCQMWSNPQTATGGPVTLQYTVGYLPTTITVTADDSAATPTGTPTAGAPDPARVDSRQEGSIVSGTVTKRTVFTMRVSNAQGSSTCNVTVPFNAAPQGNLTLPLLATLLDLPNQMVYPGPTVGNQGIQTAAYSNGTFAFSGACGGPKDQNYLSSNPPFRQGGAWFFKDDGTFLAQRDLCMDGGSRFQSLFLHGGATSRMIADGDRGFFMAVRSDGGSVQGNTYGSGAEHAGYYQVAGGNVLFTPSSNFTVRDFEFASAGGKVVGNVQVGLDGNSGKNVTLSTPSLQILAQREEFSIRPDIGFGDYILGITGTPTGPCASPAGHIPTVFKVEADGGLTSVQTLTLPDGLCPSKMAIDYTTSPKRLAVTSNTGRSGNNLDYSNRIFLFTAGANGLEPAGELQIPASVLSNINTPNFATFPAFAVGGSYLAFGGRSGTTEDYLTLWRDGALVGEAQAPMRRENGPDTAGVAATNPSYMYITPQGKIMAGGIRQAYLFGTSGGVPPPVPPVPPVPPGPSPSEIPGQTLNIIHATTSDATIEPAILIRLAKVLSSSATSLSVSIFGRNYTVDPSRARVLDMNWLPIGLASILPGSYVNVWGSLDLADSAIIHAVTIRSPLPAGMQPAGTTQSTPFSMPASNFALPATTFSFPVAPATPAAAAATQTQLNTLQQALRALQLRLAQ